MNIAIFGKVLKEHDRDLINELISCMLEAGIACSIYKDFYGKIEPYLTEKSNIQIITKDSDKQPDLIFTLGGDGTLLHSISLTQNGEIPVFGINTGRLGFLTSVNKKEIKETIQALLQKDYYIRKRSLLLLKSSENLFGDWNYALNECTVLKSDSTSMITVHVYLDGEFLNTYWGDGLIVSTPTGSTGYSLSCGGPIVSPDAKNVIITPIAPHNLSIRPIVLTDDKVITLKVEGRSDHFLCTLDSRSVPIQFNTELTLHKAPFILKMVRLKNYSFLKTIRQKLKWGEDLRNQK